MPSITQFMAVQFQKMSKIRLLIKSILRNMVIIKKKIMTIFLNNQLKK